MKSARPFSVLFFAVLSAAFIVQAINRFIERERFIAWGYMVLALLFSTMAFWVARWSKKEGGTKA